MKLTIVITAVLTVVAIISLTAVVTVLAITIDRQLFSIEEQEDGSLEVYDRSNNTQIASFDNVTEMLDGMPEVIQDMTEYYSDRNLTDIVVTR